MNSNLYKRASSTHVLDLYIPDEELYTNFILLSNIKPPAVESSSIVKTDIRKKTDGRWILQFMLQDEGYIELFQRFFEDILKSSETLNNPNRGPAFIAGRYLQWKRLFSPSSSKRSEKEIRGIIGELVFLKDFLLLKYHSSVALNAWIASKKGKQDFVFEDLWYEVKTKTPETDFITISSIDQLDSENPGILAVITLLPSSTNSTDCITLSRLYNGIFNQIEDERDRELFREIMSEYTQIDCEYDAYAYAVSDVQRYSVSREFPILRRCNVPEAVKDAEYELKLDEVRKYRV